MAVGVQLMKTVLFIFNIFLTVSLILYQYLIVTQFLQGKNTHIEKISKETVYLKIMFADHNSANNTNKHSFNSLPHL